MKHYTRVLARVDLDAVEYNIEMMKKNIQKDTQMMAVIKMDGYGQVLVPFRLQSFWNPRIISGVMQ